MTSFQFLALLLVFVPVIMIAYHFVRQDRRWIVLLAASYAFYFFNEGWRTVFLVLSTISIYLIGKLLDRMKEQKRPDSIRKILLAGGLAINFGMLFFVKFSNLVIMPLGISFYIMMAASYLIDVYRGSIHCDRNLGRVALFLGFFPQVMEGPMSRYSQTSEQLYKGEKFEYSNICHGYQRILIGMAKRMLVADRVNNYVNNIFGNYYNADGVLVILATLCYTFQLYMDFSGTIDIVLGIGEVFGIFLPENFKRPFFSQTVSEFWTRWHITLGAWFRDYIFYPVSMSKPMKKTTKMLRKRIGNIYGPIVASSVALLLVWIGNGIWHGSGWKYIFFGMYYFAFILAGNLISPIIKDLATKLKINLTGTGWKVFRIIRTFLIVNLGEMFFRVDTLSDGFGMLRSMVFGIGTKDISFELISAYGLDPGDLLLLVAVAAVLLIAGLNAEKGNSIRKQIDALNPYIRWTIYGAFIVAIIVFGGYGIGYTYVEPIYAKF